MGSGRDAAVAHTMVGPEGGGGAGGGLVEVWGVGGGGGGSACLGEAPAAVFSGRSKGVCFAGAEGEKGRLGGGGGGSVGGCAHIMDGRT